MGWLARLFGRNHGKDVATDKSLPASPRPAAVARHAAPAASGPGGNGYAVVDVETTGFSPRNDRIVSIAVVLVDPRGQVQHEWSTLVNPQCAVGATHIHGIHDVDVIEAPAFGLLVSPLVQMMTGRVFTAHNARFDESFLRYEFGRSGWSWPAVPKLCTMEESNHFLPYLARRRLADCCWACGFQLVDTHTALADARATAHLLRHFLSGGTGTPALMSHRAVVGAAARTMWPTAPGTGRIADPGRPAATQSQRAVASMAAQRARPTTTLLESFTLSDALDEGAPQGALSYLETLVEVLEDGQLSESERQAMADIVDLYGLTGSDVVSAHSGFLRALAREAFDDGVLTRAERAELKQFADLLGVDDRTVSGLLSGEEEARLRQLSTALHALPAGWLLGEPLRVGERIALTGCEASGRDRLEQLAVAVGLRVTGSVSRRTAVLVSDGTVTGRKAEAAQQFGIRVVEPEEFEMLVRHIQPWESRTAASSGLRRNHPADGAAALSASLQADPTAAANGAQANPATVRAWAIAEGLTVGARGRMSSDIWTAYARATATAE